MNKKKVVCIIQARTGSSRLPNKILLELGGKKVLGQDIENLQKSKLIDKIVIACPDKKSDDVIEKYVRVNYPKVGVFRGSENDVLDRYYQAALENNSDVVVRITSDCPLVDAVQVDKVIQALFDNNVDYTANILGKRTYPRGLDTEVMTFYTLEKIWQQASEVEDREHVTLYLRKNPKQFSTFNVENEEDYSSYRLTLDTGKDYKLLKNIFENLEDFSLQSVINYLKDNQDLILINKDIKQKYGQY